MRPGYIINGQGHRVDVMASDDRKYWLAIKHQCGGWRVPIRDRWWIAIYPVHDVPEAEADQMWADYCADMLTKGAV